MLHTTSSKWARSPLSDQYIFKQNAAVCLFLISDLEIQHQIQISDLLRDAYDLICDGTKVVMVCPHL